MFCWIYIWSHVRGFANLAGIVLFPTLLILMLWSPERWVSRRWLRIALRLLAAVPAAGIVFLLPAILLAGMLEAGDSSPEMKPVVSPDGKTVAVLKYQAGFLGRDGLTVRLRKVGGCQCGVAYEHFGSDYLGATDIAWIDSSNLKISYFADRDHIQKCHNTAGSIHVECVVKTTR